MSFWDLGPVVLPRLSIFLWWAGSRIPYFSRFAGRPRISTSLPLSLMYAQRCVIVYLKRALFFLHLKYNIYIGVDKFFLSLMKNWLILRKRLLGSQSERTFIESIYVGEFVLAANLEHFYFVRDVVGGVNLRAPF